eukprot:Lithocolla_globosa_v1_NODE_1870_length_2282_cov_7.635384.p2 type:complete len:110 gc:universal NODE_1870_length_2282_cov_7.635384:1573-1902(+)
MLAMSFLGVGMRLVCSFKSNATSCCCKTWSNIWMESSFERSCRTNIPSSRRNTTSCCSKLTLGSPLCGTCLFFTKTTCPVSSVLSTTIRTRPPAHDLRKPKSPSETQKR